jgi:hypothetical protein
MRKNLTVQEARAVYEFLVAEAGAPAFPEDVGSFVAEFTGESPTNEWRFQGSLGFGGKFRFPRMTVDCYPEDETAERLDAIKRTNARLATVFQSLVAVPDGDSFIDSDIVQAAGRPVFKP